MTLSYSKSEVEGVSHYISLVSYQPQLLLQGEGVRRIGAANGCFFP